MSPGRSVARASSADDFRDLARRRLPRVLFDSIDGAAGDERTMHANRAAFDDVVLRPLQANAPISVDVSVDLLGQRLDIPVLLAPCGSARVIHPLGEVAVARAAARAGTAYVVPHLGGTDCATVAANGSGLWYQIYQYGGREVSEPAMRRAWDAGYRTLVVTVDNARTARHRDARNGLADLLGGSRWQALPHAAQLVARPTWFTGFVRSGRPLDAPNAILPDGRLMRRADLVAAAAAPGATFRWRDFDWIRRVWPGPVVAKGILTEGDAKAAVAAGAAGVVVSNHGGRSIDGLEASLRALPEVASALDGSGVAIILDGGVRSASDVLKALGLGAQAVMIGRPYMFALSHGERGVTRLLGLLHADLRRSLAALGCARLDELGPDFVRVAPWWRHAPTVVG